MMNNPLIRLFAINFRDLSVYFTHEKEILDFVKLCNNTAKIRRITTFNTFDKKLLASLIRPEIELRVSLGAVDRSIFKPLGPKEVNECKYVLIVGVLSDRKNPGVIKEVIENHPHFNFIIHGDNWESLWGDSSRKPRNVDIRKFNFEVHPDLIRRASCLLTISELEGGPYPTLEALASGTPVVASKTGWNPELIDETNGILIDDIRSTKEIGSAIGKALLLKTTKMNEDLLPKDYNWARVGRSLY
jgi:glycosyltransferase involved in cell wall biosynthesis